MKERKIDGHRFLLLRILAGLIAFSVICTLISGLYLLPQKVACITVSGSQLDIQASGYGSIKENKRAGLYLNLPVKIKEVYVKSGDRVREGDVLATIDLDSTRMALNMQMSGIVSYNASEEEEITASTNLSDLASMENNRLASEMDKIPAQITAKYNALVTEVNIEPDGFSNPYTPMFVLSDISRILAVVSIEETAAAQIKEGQAAVVTGKGLKRSYHAKVDSVDARASQQVTLSLTQSKVNITLEILDADAELKPGLSAQAEITVNQLDQAIIIPYESVTVENGEDCVYILKLGRAVLQKVTIGDSYDNGMLITQGLSSGDKLIANPADIKNIRGIYKEKQQ